MICIERMKKALFVFCLSFVCISSYLTHAEEAKNREVYAIGLGTDAADFDNDQGIKLSGDEIKGNVFIFINGNPVAAYHAGGLFKQVNQYLKNGINTISIQGDFDKTLYLKLALMKGDEFQSVIAKKTFKAHRENMEPLEFTLKLNYSLPIFMKQNLLPEKIDRKSLFKLLKNMQVLFDKKEYSSIAEIVFKQRVEWMSIAYGTDSSQLEMMKNQTLRFYSQNSVKYFPPKLDEIKIVKGKSMIYVYSHIDEKSFFKTMSLGYFQVNGANKLSMPSMRLVYIQKKWCIWE